ncbi:MAG: hypothetical protein HC884_14865 [Chloroflexaceae bacterium]|nr:hypothetical protein [Chloroflexaceae bacterium]
MQQQSCPPASPNPTNATPTLLVETATAAPAAATVPGAAPTQPPPTVTATSAFTPTQAVPTTTATPTSTPATIPADRTIINGGNLRSIPQVAPETIIGQVCPGDQVTTLETQGEWVRVRLLTPAADCVSQRAAAGSEGRVSGGLTVMQQPHTGGNPAMPAGLTAAIVSNVVDGDTLDVTIASTAPRIRMIGIDAPETKHPEKPVECFGREATTRASELLQGQVVLLETDQSQGDVDPYGRLLRFVWLPDGTMVNQALIAEGYAFEYSYRNHSKIFHFPSE